MRDTGKLTTHVLDTAHGCPAGGVALRLFGVSEEGDTLLVTAHTNADGRCEKPLLSSETMKTGQYRLEFDVAAYFRQRGVRLPDPAFLETVPVAFGIADPGAHFHVPLLISPFGYSTYRGS